MIRRYFIHGSDEIRSIKNEKEYFKFFITRNARYNDRQRFAMNGKSNYSLAVTSRYVN